MTDRTKTCFYGSCKVKILGKVFHSPSSSKRIAGYYLYVAINLQLFVELVNFVASSTIKKKRRELGRIKVLNVAEKNVEEKFQVLIQCLL